MRSQQAARPLEYELDGVVVGAGTVDVAGASVGVGAAEGVGTGVAVDPYADVVVVAGVGASVGTGVGVRWAQANSSQPATKALISQRGIVPMAAIIAVSGMQK